MSLDKTEGETETEHVSLVDAPIEALLEHGRHAVRPTDLVIIPGSHHRRTIKQRFAQAAVPRDSVSCVSPRDIADELHKAAWGESPAQLDRADRLHLMELALEQQEMVLAQLARVLCVTPTADLEAVERARSAIEEMTAFHPSRIDALRQWSRESTGPVAADCLDLLEGVVALERTLRRRTDHATSSGMQLRSALRELDRTGGQLWAKARPSIERLWLCGVTAPTASLCDLLNTVGRRTSTQVHIGARSVSGAVIRARIDAGCAVSDPGTEVV